MNLPSTIDLCPDGDLVERANIGQEGYYENIEYTLTISISDNITTIEYCGEDGTYLDKQQIEQIIKANY